jgi:protein-S-isoprenylcysteine O-methyltransferase Ste14
MNTETLAFLAFTLIVGIVSRRSLLSPISHGFPRFFAFEAIGGLVLFNLPSWFTNPLSLRQIVSWLFLTGSAAMAVQGFMLLRSIRRSVSPDRRSDLQTNLPFENTPRIVERGLYRYIRHPLYGSLLFLAWGVLLKDINGATLSLAVTATGCLVLTAVFEERENVVRFGPAYIEYMKRTRRFFPSLR